MSSQEAKISCPSCGNQYPWTPKLAGRRGRCKCGAVIRIPLRAPRLAAADRKSAAIAARPLPTPKPVAVPGCYEGDDDVSGDGALEAVASSIPSLPSPVLMESRRQQTSAKQEHEAENSPGPIQWLMSMVRRPTSNSDRLLPNRPPAPQPVGAQPS